MHKNARLTPRGRERIVRQVASGQTPEAVAEAAGVCPRTARKAGVTVACRYEPGINRTYQELAEHYDTAILPARPSRPRDKAKVEVAVQIVQRFVLARLRNRRFFSLHELNAAIRDPFHYSAHNSVPPLPGPTHVACASQASDKMPSRIST